MIGPAARSFSMALRFRSLGSAALFALLILCVVFPDVIFNGTSLRITDQLNGQANQMAMSRPFPVPDHTGWWSGQADTGGALYQSEPMSEFVRSAFSTGQSIYWNPFAGLGAMGPEALVDLKLSFSTLAYVISGGGSLAYNIIYLLSYLFGLCALFACTRHHLGMSLLATIASGFFFVANGYIAASMGSNTALSYPFLPLLLYAALLLIEQQTALRIAVFSTCLAILMSFTFMPTTVTSLIAVGTIAAAYGFQKIGPSERPALLAGRIILSILVGGVLAGMIVSPIYLPLIENLHTSGLLEEYKRRIFYGLYFPNAVTSFLSPSLFFESYNAMEPRARFFYSSDNRSFTGNTVYALGAIGILLASGCLPASRKNLNAVVIAAMLLTTFTVVRLFDPYVVRVAMSRIPVIGNLGYQYWWPCIVIPMTFLIGFGIDRLRQQTFNSAAMLTVMTGFALAGYFMWTAFGLAEPHIDYKLLMLGFVCASAITFAVLTLMSGRQNAALRKISCICIIFLLAAELLINAKAVRYPRNDLFTALPPSIQYVKDHAGLSRTLNFGAAGLYPDLASALSVQELSTMSPARMPAYQDYFYSVVDLDFAQRIGVGPTYPKGAFPALLLAKDDPDMNRVDISRLSLVGVRFILLPLHYHRYIEWFVEQGFKPAFEDQTTIVLENPSPIARAFLVPTAVAPVSDFTLPSTSPEAWQAAAISSYANTSVTIKGVADSDGIVVLTDAWHPGWSATVNGEVGHKILRVDGLFRGIPVTKGPYEVRLDYRPRTLSFALWLSLIGALIVIAIMIWQLPRMIRREAVR